MKVLNFSFLCSYTGLFNNRVMPELSATNKKISLVALLVLSCFALVLAVKCYFSKKPALSLPDMVQKKVDLKKEPSEKIPLTPESKPTNLKAQNHQVPEPQVNSLSGESEIINEQISSINNDHLRFGALGFTNIGQVIEFTKKTNHKITYLDLRDFKNITDENLKELITYCPNINTLSVQSDIITNESLKSLSPLTSLTSLDLSLCNQITDEGLKSLNSLTHLTSLDLSFCDHVTDEGLKNFPASLKIIN